MTLSALKVALLNPAAIGLVGAAAMGGAMYLLRALPVQLVQWIWRLITVRLVVTGDDDAFDWVNDWLSRHPYSNRARRLKLSTAPSDRKEWVLAPGFGMHVFWDGGLLIVNRDQDEKISGSGYYSRPRERFTITALGRKQESIRRIIARANRSRVERDVLGVYIWQGGYWRRYPSKAKRPMSSVFLPPAQKREILEHTEWFFGAGEWFAARGIPYRQGYLLHGKPGTGKTSLVTAIASHFEKPIYVINLSSVIDDNDLLNAFAGTSAACVVLIEDIDTAKAAKDRQDEAQSTVPIIINGPSGPPKGPGVTLSGLLNAIDGVAASEGRLLFMTTNHVDVLDPALIRSARVDRTFEIGPLEPDQVTEMAARFFPGNLVAQATAAAMAKTGPNRPAADWQVEFMKWRRRPELEDMSPGKAA